MAKNVKIDAVRDGFMFTSSEVQPTKIVVGEDGSEKTVKTGEPVSVQRVLPLPTVTDDMSAEAFGTAVITWLGSIKSLQGGATLTVVDESGKAVWDNVAANAENGLADPFLGRPISLTSVVDYIKRSLAVDHNRPMRDIAATKAGITREAGSPKASGGSKLSKLVAKK